MSRLGKQFGMAATAAAVTLVATLNLAEAGCTGCGSGAITGMTTLSPVMPSSSACGTTSYRTVCKMIYEPQQVTAYRLENETVYEERKITVHKPVWVEEVRERRYTVARPVYETSEREERVTVMRPVWETQMRDESYDRVRNVFETAEREETVTVMRPVWEEQMREERYTVQRTVEETIEREVQRTCMQPVTSYRTQVVDQGCYETQTGCKPAVGLICFGSPSIITPDHSPEVLHRVFDCIGAQQ